MKNKIIAILLVAGILAVPVAMAASQQLAQLDVRQPGWVDGEVQQKSVNGTNLYSARGTEIRIVPKNFNGSEVIDFGVETDPGSMEYDSEFNEFVFTPNGETGTFEVYWIVNEQRVVTVNNSTQVRSTQVRYTALIRVTGGVDVSHIPNQELQERKNATALGEQMQDAIDRIREMSLPLALNSGSDEEIAQAMVTRYVNTGNPIRALTGNYTAVAIIIGTTLGGLLWALQYLGILAWMIRSLRGQLNRYEVMEAEEGEVSDKVARVDEMERKGILQNVDWNDIFHDDHIARAFRETFGETPHDGYKKLVNTVILPEVWVKERLYAMSQDGWTIDLDTMELVEPGGDGA